jgi:toxin ParE1/3/4
VTRYVLSPRARLDLAEIWKYSAEHWDSEQADRYIRTLNESFAAVAKDVRLARACDEIRPGYRKFRSGSHVVFCRVTDEVVTVVRVLHSRMDFQRHL